MIVEKIENTDLAYMAGIIDGEGSICIHKTELSHKKGHIMPSHSITIAIRMVDREPLEWAQKLFGGHLKLRQPGLANRKPFYDWKIYSLPAVSFIETILPYLKVKRRQARLIMAFIKLRKAWGTDKKTKQKLIEQRDNYWNLLKRLNQSAYSIRT